MFKFVVILSRSQPVFIFAAYKQNSDGFVHSASIANQLNFNMELSTLIHKADRQNAAVRYK